MADILVLDDDKSFCEILAQYLQREGHTAVMAHTIDEGLRLAQCTLYDVVFLDICLPDGSGLDALPLLRTGIYPPEVIIITGFGDTESVELAVHCGAWDYVRKESSVKSMMLSLSRALLYRKSQKASLTPVAFHSSELIGHSPAFRTALNMAAQAAGSDANVLVTGETGTGKELFSIAIHVNSHRAAGSFVVVDCAALPETLIGSTLFGHEKGAFTGAEHAQDGLIAQADGGTLFLDEIGDMPLEIQRTLLRVLQEHRFRPIGASNEVESNFRVIAATNRDLDQLVKDGKFRSDLLFRLRTLTVSIPPLRQRKEDIPVLVTHFVSQECRLREQHIKGISEDLTEAMLLYSWPGNVRELAQAISSAVTQADQAPLLFANHLPVHIRVPLVRAIAEKYASPLSLTEGDMFAFPRTDMNEGLLPLQQMRNQFESNYLKALIHQCNHSIEEACRISGLSRPHVYTLLKKHGLKLT